jgi:hypothetical protein
LIRKIHDSIGKNGWNRGLKRLRFELPDKHDTITIETEFHKTYKGVWYLHFSVLINYVGEYHNIVLYQFNGAADAAAVERQDIILIIYGRDFDGASGFGALITSLIYHDFWFQRNIGLCVYDTDTA